MRAALDRRSHLLLAISCVLLLALAEWANLDDHLWKLWQEVSTPQTVKDSALWLPDYQVTGPAMVIPKAETNASGITYDPDRDSLWVVADRPPQLLELDRKLALKRRIALSHFEDPEAIVYLGNERFIIADERTQTLVVAVIDPDTTELFRNALSQLSVRLGPKGN